MPSFVYLGVEPINQEVLVKLPPMEILNTEEFNKLLGFRLKSVVTPTADQMDLAGFDIASGVMKIAAVQNEKYKAYQEKLLQWVELTKGLTDKEILEKIEDDESYRKPAEVNEFTGVIVGKDIPLYAIPHLKSYLYRNNIDTYYLHEPYIMVDVGLEPSTLEGVNNVISEPVKSGELKLINV